MKKQNLVISLVTNDINDVVKLMFKHPIISEYINKVDLVGDSVFKNSCYQIVNENPEAYEHGKATRICIYLNPAYMVCV